MPFGWFLGCAERVLWILLNCLSTRRRSLGEADARTVAAASNLASDLIGLGHYQRALDILVELRPTPQAQNPSSRAALLGARTFSIALRKTGRFNEALLLARQNYEDFHTYFGPDHYDTLACTLSLANASLRLAVAERRPPVEARELARLAAARYRRIFGERNPLTLAAEVNLAITLRALGDRRAGETDRMTLAELCQVLGDDHPYTLAAANNYAVDLALANDVLSARELLRRTLTTSRLARGKDHPDTLAVAVNLALYTLRTETGVGQSQLDAALEQLRRILGSDHPAAVSAARGAPAELDIEPPLN